MAPWLPNLFPSLPHILHFLSAILFAFLLVLITKFFSNPRKSRTEPPGSLGFPLIGETIAFLAASNSREGVYQFVQDRRFWYGNCFKARIFGSTNVFFPTTEAAKSILSNDFVHFTKRYIRSMAEAVGDQSLLCAPQQLHKLIRSHLSDLFTRDSLSLLIRYFDDSVVKILKTWEHRETVVVLDDALKVIFTVICKMLISIEGSDELEKLQKDIGEVCEAMVAFPFKFPGTRFFKGIKARKRIMVILTRLIAQRRNGEEFHDDFLQSLLKKDDSQHNGKMTDAQIRDNILTLIIAGQVTTAAAVTWMIKYLDENQDVQESLRALHLPIAKKACGSSLGLEDINDMPYASKQFLLVVKESLRMATIVPWFPRVALNDCEIEGFCIRKNWIVNVDARSIHYDPTVYKEPMKFDPSRYDEDQKPYSFLAFGTGGRTCLGMHFAKAMMLIFLHRLVTTYRWEVLDHDPSLGRTLFPTLKSGCPIRVMPITQQMSAREEGC